MTIRLIRNIIFDYELQDKWWCLDRPVLKILSNCGLRHQAQDQAEDILKLHSIPGWSEERKKMNGEVNKQQILNLEITIL